MGCLYIIYVNVLRENELSECIIFGSATCSLNLCICECDACIYVGALLFILQIVWKQTTLWVLPCISKSGNGAMYHKPTKGL